MSSAVRTRETAAPLAEHFGLTPFVIGDPGPLVQHLKANFQGRAVLVAGHSNTVPEIITRLGGAPISPIGPIEIDRLCVVTVTELLKRETLIGPITLNVPQQQVATVHELRYGRPT